MKQSESTIVNIDVINTLNNNEICANDHVFHVGIESFQDSRAGISTLNNSQISANDHVFHAATESFQDSRVGKKNSNNQRNNVDCMINLTFNMDITSGNSKVLPSSIVAACGLNWGDK